MTFTRCWLISYHHAVIIDNTIYLSGVAGVDPKTNKLVEGGTVAETNQALLNMKQVLSVANSKMSNGKLMKNIK
ncbi:hypothetical protein C0J52_03085 [Blattella germanica]|nr:hypothetical protein C0J52_03085 [Blattella germanica]